jgi:hypothetical protein
MCGLNYTGIKNMWDEKFKSPTVTRTKHAGQTVTRTKRQGTEKNALGNNPFLLLMFLEV